MFQGIGQAIIDILDWIQEKSHTKFGIFLIGTVSGLVLPLPHINYQNKQLAECKLQYEELNQKMTDWQERAFEAENNYIQRTKEMIVLFEDIEQYYNHKLNNQQQLNDVMKKYLDELNKMK